MPINQNKNLSSSFRNRHFFIIYFATCYSLLCVFITHLFVFIKEFVFFSLEYVLNFQKTLKLKSFVYIFKLITRFLNFLNFKNRNERKIR
jgi:hypothetical protein